LVLSCTLTFAIGLLAIDARGEESLPGDEAPLVTEFFVAPAAAFRTNADLDFGDYVGIDWELGYMYAKGCAHAQVDLPQGATVVSLVGYIWDQEVAGDVVLSLRRRSASGGGPADVMASVAATSHLQQIVAYPDFTIDFPTVDNRSYTYFLVYCDFLVGGAQRIYTARVGFNR